MSQRHTLVTSYLYAPVMDVARVETVLRDACFIVEPHHSESGRIAWYSAMFKDLAQGTATLEMDWLPELVERLDGLLPQPWTIAVAWEADTYEGMHGLYEGPPYSCNRQHVWAVRGRDA